MLDIKIVKTSAPKTKPADESKLGFGKIFSDHMFVMDYSPEQGWHDARVVPYAPFQMDPATVVFHYAQELFEGLKAYRAADGRIQLFRPECNGQRMQDSSERMCIPTIPVDDFVQAVKALVEVDKDWVPHSEGTSLYIRPFTIATMEQLGVHASTSYQFIIICSPSGAYYAEAVNALYARGVVSGVGGGRYSPDSALTRQDAICMVQRAMRTVGWSANDGYAGALAGYSDGDSVSGYAQGAMSFAVQRGYLPTTGGRLSPTQPLTRVDMAEIIHRVLTY